MKQLVRYDKNLFVNCEKARFSFLDCGHVKIKDMIRTLEANSRHRKFEFTSSFFAEAVFLTIDPTSNPVEASARQRPLSQPTSRLETSVEPTAHHHRPFDTSTDDAKILSSTKTESPQLNLTQRSDVCMRSITKYFVELFIVLKFSSFLLVNNMLK